jgi:hypothetical protein
MTENKQHIYMDGIFYKVDTEPVWTAQLINTTETGIQLSRLGYTGYIRRIICPECSVRYFQYDDHRIKGKCKHSIRGLLFQKGLDEGDVKRNRSFTKIGDCLVILLFPEKDNNKNLSEWEEYFIKKEEEELGFILGERVKEPRIKDDSCCVIV